MGAEGRIVLSVDFDKAQAQKAAGQLKSVMKKEIGNFNLDNLFDDKKIQQSVQTSIGNINKILSKSKFKNLDFASFVPKMNNFLSDKKIPEKNRSQEISNFEYRLSVLDKYGSKDIIPLLKNEDIMNSYMKDLTNIVDFVKSISGLKTSEQNRLIKDLSKGDADDITSAFALKDIEKKYGNNIKYKVKPKDVMSLLETAYEKLDITNEESLRNFLGLYNRGKYLATTDKTRKGILRNSFKEFETNYKQDIIGVREGHPELFNEMERIVLGMSKDFDNLYNTKYRGKVLDTSDLIKGLKIDRSISKISDTQTDTFPTTSRQIVDSLTETKTDVKELENEIEQVEKKTEQVEKKAEEAHNIANEIKETKNKDNKSSKKNNVVDINTDTTKNNNQDKSLAEADSIQQVENEVEDELEKVENDIDKLEKEKEALKLQKKITAEVKQKLEEENKEINKIINKNYKDDSKTNNYNRLKNQYENYKEKAQKSDEESKKLDSFETNSPEWFSQLVSFQEANAEEKIAWMKYYKAYDVAKNGKNKVAESRLKKFAPENLETEFDNNSYEIYLQDLKERYKKNTEEINGLDKDIDEYFQKINKLNEKINDINSEENDIVNNNKPQSNNQKDSTQNYILPDDLMSNIYEGINNTNDADNSNINNIAQAEGELENNTNKANSALEEQTDIINNLAKTTENLMYHMGHIDDEKTILSNTFGQELQNPNKYNIGTGLYTTKSSKDYSKSVLSQEDLDEYYAIDVSELNMYEAHAEETAKEFYDFVHHLEQFCIMMGSNFEGFDDNLENIDEESLYSTAQKLFPNIEQAFIDFDEFDDFINEMINYVSKSGINADGTINPVKMHLFQKEFGTDDIKTRFLKELDYQGVDLSGTSYGNQLGSIIFDSLDKSKILVSGKNIEQIVEEAANRIRQEQDSKSEPFETTTPTNKPTSTKKNVEEQEELRDAVEKTTDAIKNQQEVLSQGKEATPSQSSTKKNESLDEIEQPDDNKKKSKSIAKPKPKTNNKDDSRETSITNEINQSENNSANEGIGESNSFKLITGSAEEAAEAKRKFVEANKEVLQSIVASMPKIEQEADALEKVEEVQNKSSTKTSKTESEKEKGIKGYFDFEAMPNDLIEQRYAEISPLPIMAKGVSLASNRLNDEVQSSVELLEELHTAWDRGQQEIKDIIYDSTIENMQQEYVESQPPLQYDFEPDYDDIEKQAKEARQYYEDQISNDFEVKVETQLDLKQDETGQLSLFDNVLPEENWGQEVETKTNNISEAAIKGQISFQQLQEAIENSERAFAKLSSSKNTNGKSFLQNTDIPNDVLEKYENISTTLGKGYEATGNLQELKNLSDELTDVKTKLRASFDETGNLKSTVDPFEVQNLLNKYDELINKIQNLKAIISSPTSEENIALKIAKDAEKAQQELDKLRASINQKFEKGTYDNVGRKADEVINKYGFRDDNNELISSFTVGQTLNKDAGNQQQMIEALNSSLLEFEKRKENLRSLKDDPLIDADQLKQASKEVDNIKYKIEQLEKDIRANGDKMASTGSVNKFTSQVEQFMIKNPRITGEARAQLQSYMDTLNSGASVSVQSLNSMQQGFNRVFNEQLQAGNLGTNIWSQMLGKIREGAAFLLTKFSFYEVFNQFRQGIEIVHQFDDALTEMMKVSDETRSSLEAYQKTTFNTADAIGTSALQLQNSTADFMRLGIGTNVLCSAV